MGIVEDTFTEWTKGLSAEESRVRIFEKIRDIPYYIDPAHFDFEKGPTGTLEDNRGSCTPKHYIMGVMYGKLGLTVEYCTYGFHWKDQKLDYSKEVMAMAKKLPVAYHLACRVFIEGKWILVDATWDPSLAFAGFPVNIDWDGKSDTTLAVTPTEDHSCGDIHKRESTFSEKLSAYSLGEKLELSRFTIALNRWLEDMREKRE